MITGRNVNATLCLTDLGKFWDGPAVPKWPPAALSPIGAGVYRKLT